MNRPRIIRGIKITWSAFCGLAAVLLLVLWVRSYWREDTFTIQRPMGLTAVSVCGDIQLSQGGFKCMFEEVRDGFDFRTDEIGPESIRRGKPFALVRGPWEGDLEIDFPHWCPVVIALTFSALPWIRLSKAF